MAEQLLRRSLAGLVALLAFPLPLIDAPVAGAAGQDGGHPWTLAFSDEFDGNEVDPAKWDSGFGWGPRSGSSFGFCDPGNNVVGGGILTQRIERRPQGGKDWSVGCLNTRGHSAQRYGYWEARMWVAGCAGAQGMFWAKPKDESWPPGLEVVEVEGDEPTTSRHAVHWRENGDGAPARREMLSPGPDFSGGFHVFGAHWSPTGVVWYVDGVERARTEDGAEAMAQGGHFYTLVNTQVLSADSDCGADAGSAHQYVDYVRVWHDGTGAAPEPGAPPPPPSQSPPQPVGPAGCRYPVTDPEALPGLPHGVSEVSGMAASRRHPGTAWMIRDSGNAASLYALRLTADGRPAVTEYPVTGATNRDWEEIVYTVGADGRGRLWVLESGQSSRNPRTLYEILEPDPARDRTTLVVGRYRYAYPDMGRTNTEAAFSFQGDIVLVAKTSPARVYRFRQPLSKRVTNRPSYVGSLSGSAYPSVVRVSDDQQTLVAASHKQALVWEQRRPRSKTPLRDLISGPPAGGAKLGTAAAVEAADWLPRGTCALVLISEHRGVQRVRFTPGER
jgi:beta-glucanase (GH16 family)